MTIEEAFKAGYDAGRYQHIINTSSHAMGFERINNAAGEEKEQAWKEFVYDLEMQDNPPLMAQDPPTGH